MTKATAKTAKMTEASAPFPQFEMTAFNVNLFSACAQASQAFFENAMALNKEMMRFANERLQADAQVLQNLPECTSWEKAIAVQSEFARAAMDAYLVEIPQLTEQAARTCTAMWAPVLESAESLPQAVAKT